MKRFQPYSEVISALKASGFLEVNEDEEVRRKEALPESVGKEVNQDTVKLFEDKAQPRSIYAKGFGKEKSTTQVDIERFFAPYGPVNAIRLRRGADKGFKGSVFVEFADEGTQKAFLALEKKPMFDGEELLIKSKKDYVEQKAEDIRTGKIKPNTTHHGKGKQSQRDSRDWKGRRDDFQKNGYRDSDRRNGRGRGRDHGSGRRGRGREDRHHNRSRSKSPAKEEPGSAVTQEDDLNLEGSKSLAKDEEPAATVKQESGPEETRQGQKRSHEEADTVAGREEEDDNKRVKLSSGEEPPTKT